MAVRVSPSDGTAAWVSGLQNAGARITTGVDSVTVAPGRQAAAAKAKWVAAITNPQTQNKWAERVGAVDLETWRSLMKEVGIPRIASGAQAKQGKYQAFAEKFYPFLSRVVQQVEGMPSTTFADRVNRATQFMTLAHNYSTGAGA